MCDNEPKASEKSPFKAGSGLNALANVKGEKNVSLISSTIKRLHENGKYVGTSTGATDDETLTFWHDLGMDMISAGMDYAFIRDCAVKNRKNLECLHKGV